MDLNEFHESLMYFHRANSPWECTLPFLIPVKGSRVHEEEHRMRMLLSTTETWGGESYAFSFVTYSLKRTGEILHALAFSMAANNSNRVHNHCTTLLFAWRHTQVTSTGWCFVLLLVLLVLLLPWTTPFCPRRRKGAKPRDTSRTCPNLHDAQRANFRILLHS